jgi:hypothetical protein
MTLLGFLGVVKYFINILSSSSVRSYYTYIYMIQYSLENNYSIHTLIPDTHIHAITTGIRRRDQCHDVGKLDQGPVVQNKLCH